jgi:hypothetical protein
LESSNNSYALSTWARNVAIARLGASAPTADIQREVERIMQLPPGSPVRPDGSGTIAPLAARTDLRGTGGELEISYNPGRNWNIKFTGAETNSVTTKVNADIERYIALRMPIWTSLRDATGSPYWTSNGTNSPAAFYSGNIKAVMTLDQALQGKTNEQIKRHTWRLISNYRFSSGLLRNVGVGGALRWNARSAIGYLGAAPEADGVVRDYDPNKPVYDSARYTCDLWASYRWKMFTDRIAGRVQLNVQDAFENGGILPIKVNPDGVYSNYRIVNPTKVVLSTSFEF